MKPLIYSIASLFLLAGNSAAQGTQVAFGSAPQDTDQPVEITSENLAVDQEAGTALFTVDVVVVQGEMILTAPEVMVFYNEERSEIELVEATGGVTLVSGPDEAESERADYTVEEGVIVMIGDVVLNQGFSTAMSDEMIVLLDEGTATMTGRVKTILQQGGDE